MFGGSDEDYKEAGNDEEDAPQKNNVRNYHKTSDTEIISFGECSMNAHILPLLTILSLSLPYLGCAGHINFYYIQATSVISHTVCFGI